VVVYLPPGVALGLAPAVQFLRKLLSLAARKNATSERRPP